MQVITIGNKIISEGLREFCKQIYSGYAPAPHPPAWGVVKNFRKVFAGGGGQKFLFFLRGGGGPIILK